LNNGATAIAFYEKALSTPLTADETLELGKECSILLPADKLRAMFAVHTREGMARCLLEQGRARQAQKRMEEAAGMRKKHHLGARALFAGEVQAASGQRVIESRIKDAEQLSAESPRYWQERACYYRGRSEPHSEEEALVKGLALTRPQPEPDRRSRGHVDWRTRLLGDYSRFLARQERAPEAVALLRREIEANPATTESARWAVRLLAFDFVKQLRGDDPVLWNWLTNRQQWEHTEERLLWRMLERVKRGDLDAYFSRAEKVALDSHPSRASRLGWIMNRMQFPERSIPLLKHAAERLDDEAERERACFTLLESYLDTGDWKRAERIFASASARLTPKEVPDWLARIALAAVRSDAKRDAMRIWRRVANVDPSHLDGLEHLAEAGLKTDLTDFYGEMRAQMPSSDIPARALAAIDQSPRQGRATSADDSD